jgi:NAD(P)-dependent dehydrogenase (short-subunit alcohol dehydrogenase family)
VSLITGSTSGIGLGIARALPAAGSEIVLNGFGKSEEVRVESALPQRPDMLAALQHFAFVP